MTELNILSTIRKSGELITEEPGFVIAFLPPLIPQILVTYPQILLGGFYPHLQIIELSLQIVTAFFFVWSEAAVILKVKEKMEGRSLKLWKSFQQGIKKIPRLLGAHIIIYFLGGMLAAPIGMVAYSSISSVPLTSSAFFSPWKILVIILTIVFTVYLFVRLSLFPPASVLQGNFGLSASWNLVKGSWWRVAAVLLPFISIALGISALEFFDGMQFFNLLRFPDLLTFLLIGPLLIIALTLVYFKLSKGSEKNSKTEDIKKNS